MPGVTRLGSLVWIFADLVGSDPTTAAPLDPRRGR